MKNFFTTKRLCRAGIITALYVALTYAFGAIAYQGVLQIRPAEALTILPLFFPEAVPALWIGCMLANLGSPFIMFDIPLGGLATLAASLLTYGTGRLIKNQILKVAVGGFFPVIVNAFFIPVIIVFLCDGEATSIAYWTYFGSLCATQALWVTAWACLCILRFTTCAKRAFRHFPTPRKSRRRKKIFSPNSRKTADFN